MPNLFVCVTIRICKFSSEVKKIKEKLLVFLRFKTIFSFVLMIFLTASVAFSQETAEKPDTKAKKENKKSKNDDVNKNFTAEQVAESSIIIYGGYGGRQNLGQIRKTTFERGKITLTDPKGKVDLVNYQRWVLRSEKLDSEKIRFEQEFPNAKYSMVYNGEKIFGVFNDAAFVPREDAVKSFQNQVWHGLEAFLRYKENESKIALVGREKIAGVEYFILDVTDKLNRKTTFYISTKSLYVKMLDYVEDGIKYRRKFYDYNFAQGTVVPYRTVLYADDKQIEETEIGTITYGQKVEEALFKES